MGRASDVPRVVRGLVYDRDERRCQSPRCGRHDQLTLQHRVGRGMGSALADPHRPSNLLTLCFGCHMRVEAHPRTSNEHGWSVPPGTDPADWPVWSFSGGWLQLLDEGTTVELADHPGVPGCGCGCTTTPAAGLWAPLPNEGRPSRWTR